jgi:imidazolonepropionase-like amidohydrolase
MRPLLAAANATVILAPPMQRVSGMERWNSTLEAAALLGDGDVSFVLATGYEAYVPKSRVLLWETGMAAANGLSRERAISSVTIDAARLWGIEDRVGSLEVGKDADLVLFNGDPLEYTTLVEHVIIDGELVTP